MKSGKGIGMAGRRKEWREGESNRRKRKVMVGREMNGGKEK